MPGKLYTKISTVVISGWWDYRKFFLLFAFFFIFYNKYTRWGTPPNTQNFLMRLYTYSYIFKHKSLSKYSPSDAIHLLRHFFSYGSEQFLNSCVSAIFCFTAYTLAKCSPLRTFSIQGGKRWWIGRVGHGGHTIFGQKLLNTQHYVGRCVCKSPVKKWAKALKESSKKLHQGQTQPLTTTPAGTMIQMGS